jgi:hypothetical protein
MSSKSQKLILKKNKKLDKIYHPDSGLVFKSATEKVVIGRIVDDEFISLDEATLELCEQYNFKYDESLVETEEVDETQSQKSKSSEEEKSDHNEEPSIPQSTAVTQTVSQPVALVPVLAPKPVEHTTQSKLNDSSVNIENILNSFTENIKNVVCELNNQVSLLKQKLSEMTEQNEKAKELNVELEKQNANTKKELEDVKRKLKGVLAAMQNDL